MSKIFVFLIFIIFLPVYSFAGVYCGSHLIQEGDSSYSVKQYCGKPLSQDKVSGDAQTYREQWVYHINGYRVIITMWDNKVVVINEERLE